MADKVLPGPVAASSGGASVNIHTSKILDACRDKDCIDDLRVYPTVSSQAILDSAFSVRPESASLLCADVSVDAISFNRGYYTVDVTYFYLVTGQTFPGGAPVRGLAVFDKRVILYGGEGGVRSFSSRRNLPGTAGQDADPVAVVEAVDPIALNLRIGEKQSSCEDTELRSIPPEIVEAIGESLDLSGTGKRLYVTLGQFSIIRLERDYLLTLDAENYLPDSECGGSSGGSDDPCTLFSRVRFPVEEFYPSDQVADEASYRDLL